MNNDFSRRNSIFFLTIFPVKADLSLILLLTLQSFKHLLHYTVTGLSPMKEGAGAGFLHDLCPNKTSQLTKTIRTIDDPVIISTPSISQNKVAVCE